ncbi:MAG TPA: YceI family protein [Acidimicrobiales bacterium]|nr:YceI family protein [Acidimicrobiales bacterium]
MARSARTIWGAAGAVVVLGVAALAGWWFLVRDDAPPEADIDAAGETLDEAATPGTGDASSGTAGVDGTWSVDPSVGSFADFSGTWAGYRFDEELVGIGGNTAVGRTPDVSGTMTVADGAVTGVDVEVDLTTLDSDSDRRDGALRSRGLESDRFPGATFTLTDPVTLPAGLTDGERATVTANGELTIHGVTKEAAIELQAELQGDNAVVVGNAPIALTDYGIDPPMGFSVLSISGDGTFELQLFFSKG